MSNHRPGPWPWRYSLAVLIAMLAIMVISGAPGPGHPFGERTAGDGTQSSVPSAALSDDSGSGSSLLTARAAGRLAELPSEVVEAAGPPQGTAVDGGSEDDSASVLRVSRNDSRLKLRGTVPTEDDQKAILGIVKASFPSLDISDRLKTGAAVRDRQTWLGGVGFALKIMAQLRSGSASLRDNRLEIEGRAADAESYTAVQQALQEQLPNGIVLDHSRIGAPSDNAYQWIAQFKLGGLALSGQVPDQQAQQALQALASEIFPGSKLINAMEVAAGAPGNWVEAAAQALRVLRLLESGSIRLTDQVVRIEGIAPDQATIDRIESLGGLMPEGFDIDNALATKRTGRRDDREQPEPGVRAASGKPAATAAPY